LTTPVYLFELGLEIQASLQSWERPLPTRTSPYLDRSTLTRWSDSGDESRAEIEELAHVLSLRWSILFRYNSGSFDHSLQSILPGDDFSATDTDEALAV